MQSRHTAWRELRCRPRSRWRKTYSPHETGRVPELHHVPAGNGTAVMQLIGNGVPPAMGSGLSVDVRRAAWRRDQSTTE